MDGEGGGCGKVVERFLLFDVMILAECDERRVGGNIFLARQFYLAPLYPHPGNPSSFLSHFLSLPEAVIDPRGTKQNATHCLPTNLF